jgi:hypothetical protein
MYIDYENSSESEIKKTLRLYFWIYMICFIIQCAMIYGIVKLILWLCK